MAEKRAHIHYSGMVQGVGFRYAAERLASEFKIKGWVKNLRDGRVEVLCEGDERDIGFFIEKINSIFKHQIYDSSTEWGEAKRELEDFEIRID